MTALAAAACRLGRRVAAVPGNVKARRAVLARLAELDPDADDNEITNLLLGRVFPDAWFHQALFTVSYYRQFLRALCNDHLLETVDMQPASPAMRKATRIAVDAYFRARRRIPGPAREDNIIRPWTKEYGRIPDSSEVGPSWSLGIAPEPRKCPV